MAKPILTYMEVPVQSTGNPIKGQLRTQQRTVGSDLVQEQVVTFVDPRDILGVYFASFNGTYAAVAHVFGTSGFFWLINPVGSAVNVAVDKLFVQNNIVTSLSTPTFPILTFTRFSFTGTASGATIAAAKRATADAAAIATLRTAITGLTCATQGNLSQSAPPVAVGTAGWAAVQAGWQEVLTGRDFNDELVLAAGEGLCLWQSVNGTTADTRQFICNIRWSEYTA